jgi:hypothetical protein
MRSVISPARACGVLFVRGLQVRRIDHEHFHR